MKYLSFILPFLIIFAACNDDELITNSSAKITFSNDTIYFDTIFTDIGSFTKDFRVYNNNKGTIKIDRIYFGKGGESEYIMNVNGVFDSDITDVEIPANDSIFIFIQAKLKENNEDTLVFKQDAIVFEYNKNISDVDIVSWGQDVTQLHAKSVNTETWTSQKPYLIFDSLVVNEGETLTLAAGVTLHFTFNSNLIVKGNLVCEGTLDNPVRFLQDHLEYKNVRKPGQWGSIQIRESSTGNSFKHTIIKNAITGLYVENGTNGRIPITLENTKIENMTYAGIWAKNVDLKANNCVFSNCAEVILAIMGGKHSYIHCTIGNETNLTGNYRKTESVYITDFDLANRDSISFLTDSIYFANCIIAGDRDNEFEVDIKNTESLLCKVTHTLLKYKKPTEDTIYFDSVYYFNKDSLLFIDGDYNNFQLDTLSQAMNKANFNIAKQIPSDLNGNDRLIDEKPDLGAYEYFYEIPVE